MKFTVERVREFRIDFENCPSHLVTLFETEWTIDFIREFVNTGVDMDEFVCRMYNNYRSKFNNSVSYLTFANWINATEPRLKEFLKKDRRRFWD